MVLHYLFANAACFDVYLIVEVFNSFLVLNFVTKTPHHNRLFNFEFFYFKLYLYCTYMLV